MITFLIMKLMLILLLLLAHNADKPRLETRVFPAMQTVDLAKGCSQVLMTAEIKGTEDEGWYCPQVIWEMPDGTQAMEESDCAPFEEREDYPRIWRRRICAPAHPIGEPWTVNVKLKKNDKTIAFAEIRFVVK